MLTRYPITSILLLGGNVATASAGRGRHNHKAQRRQLNEEQFQKDLYGSSTQSAALREKFISKSTFVGGRRLQNYNNNNNNNYNYNNWMNGDYNNQQANNANQANNADEEAAADDDNYNYDDQYVPEPTNTEYGFNPSNFALSYHRCAAVQQFDDQVAASENTKSVFATRNFAVFRFCPAASCDAGIEEANEDEYQNNGQNNYYYNGNGYQNANGGGRKLQDEEDGAVEEEEQGGVNGARGRGCRKNYGEYMIELEDYLQIMSEHQEKRAEEYCEFCEEMMWEMYQDCLNNGNCRRNLKFDEFKDPKGFHGRVLGMDYGICELYQEACNDAIDDHLTEYFECKEANGAYIGPHCAEDGFTITLGAFKDDECNQFLGGDVSTYLGEELEEDALKPWYNSRHGTLDMLFEGEEESMCISCRKVDDEFETLAANANDDDGADDDEEDQDDENGEMSELCEMVYETSAHCNRYYKSFRKGQLSSRQWKEMQLSCSFIDSIEMGNYDELGYVNLRENWNYKDGEEPEWARDNKYATQYGSAVQDVSPLQVFFLIFTILACAILGVWSKSLHSSLTKKESWAPGRDWKFKKYFRRGDAPGIAPANSGIEASRVRSDATSYYVS